MDESGCSYIELQETDGHNRDTITEDNTLTGKCLELEMEDGKVVKCRVKSVTTQYQAPPLNRRPFKKYKNLVIAQNVIRIFTVIGSRKQCSTNYDTAGVFWTPGRMAERVL